MILLNSGRSAAGARGAASHTGALVTSDAVIAAACREAGIVRVDSPGELVDACQAFVRSPRARGRRVAVIADGGGHGSVAADLVRANGLEVPAFSDALVARIEPQLERAGSVSNPVDIIDGADGLASFTGIARTCLESGEVDAVLVTGYYGGYALYSDSYREEEPREALAMAALQAELDRPIVVHSIFADAVGGGTDLRAHGLADLRARRAGRARLRRARHRRATAGAALAAAPRCRCSARPAMSRRARCCSTPASPTATAAPRGTPTRPSRWPTGSRSTPSRSRPSTRGSCTSRTPAACASGWPTPPRCAPRRWT